ncbi:MAG: serine/threonine-protein phosphatase, partial [Zetaproteobacteria bacterium]|nr:serine/threonine-protein phosphatase [Zetaproteobacteria bacterium]
VLIALEKMRQALIQADDDKARRAAEVAEKNAQLQAAHQQIQDELEIARTLQISILPTHFPNVGHCQLYAQMEPAREMGGDFYDMFSIGQDHLGLVMADVSGKGVPAAFFMAVSRTQLRGIARNGDSPEAVLAQLNDHLCEQNPLELFVTVFYALLNTRTGELIYANGGHNPPLLQRGDSMISLPTSGGMALGIMPELPYQQHRLQLDAGDRLFMFTDGVTEAFDIENQLFGEDRLEALLREHRTEDTQQLIETVMTQLHHFSQGRPLADDITCMALDFIPSVRSRYAAD